MENYYKREVMLLGVKGRNRKSGLEGGGRGRGGRGERAWGREILGR